MLVKITLDIEEKRLASWLEMAKLENMSLEDFLQGKLTKILEEPDDKFDAARFYIRSRYHNLYKRLHTSGHENND